MSDRSEDKRLFIPVAGPWIDLSNRHCTITAPCGSNEDFAKTMIVTSGVVQGVGALAALGSLIIPETTTIQERTTTSKALPPAKPEVHVFPISLAGGAGIGASGRF